MEVWKDIKGYEGIYQVSNLGNVKSLPKKGSGGHNGKILKLKIEKNGYFRICLVKDKIKKSYNIHRLVAISFIENKNNLPCVNHINGIKTDNRVENLEWCTYSENVTHGFRVLGRKVTKKHIDTLIENNHKKAKKVNQYDLDGNFIKTWNSIKLAQETLLIYNISACVLNKRPFAGGFIWRYKKD